MRKEVFEFALMLLYVVGIIIVLASCTSDYKVLEDYRKFVDYMERTNEPFEVACETDYYTNLIQEDRK